MSIRNKPNYGVFNIPLTNAGSMDIPTIGTRIFMSGALQGATIAPVPGGGQTLVGGTPTGALVNVQIGKSLGDPIPFTVGSGCVVENKFDFVRLSWAAQAGIYATFVISDDADGNGLSVTALSSVTIGNISIVEGGNTALVNAEGQLETALYSTTTGNPVAVSGTENALTVRLKGGPLANAAFVSNPALNALPQSGAAAAPQVQPGGLGASYASAGFAAGATTLVAPASNVNGIVVRTANMTASATGQLSFCAGTSAPTTAVTNPTFLQAGENASATLPREIFLPAGQGLYVWNSGGAADAFTTYDIL